MEKESGGVTYPSTQQAAFADPADEAFRLVREAGAMAPGEPVKAGIRRAAGLLGLPFRRAKQAWYREPAAWRADEMDGMRAGVRAALLARLAREEVALAALRARIAGMAGERA